MIQVLPQGSTFVSVESFGNSAWTITGRVITLDASKQEKHYFLKVSKESTNSQSISTYSDLL